jgi:LAS superfamily LD-carboxypeptidase LdcB
VAPPGTSLHRYATELDLGPAAAYGWLEANCHRFGFVKRYAWGKRSMNSQRVTT